MAIEGLVQTHSLCEGEVRQVARIALSPLRADPGATGLNCVGRIDPHTEITVRRGGGGVDSFLSSMANTLPSLRNFEHKS